MKSVVYSDFSNPILSMTIEFQNQIIYISCIRNPSNYKQYLTHRSKTIIHFHPIPSSRLPRLRLNRSIHNLNFIYILTVIPIHHKDFHQESSTKRLTIWTALWRRGITLTLYIELRGSPFTTRTSTRKAPRRDSPYGQPCG